MAEPVQEASILSVRDLSPAVRQLKLSPQERPVHFAAGQWVSLNLPVGPRPPLVRAYSMADPEAATGELVLVFDRVPGGLGSNYLYTLKAGDTVVVSGPYGKFQLPERLDKELLFIGRFTGIVPIRCMIMDLLMRRDPGSELPAMTLIYAGPATDLIYDTEFRELTDSQPHFRYAPIVLDHHHETSTIDAETLRAVIGERRQLFPLLAGTKAFVRPLRTLLLELGFERREMRQETYD